MSIESGIARAWPFVVAGYCVAHGIGNINTYLVSHSPASLLKIGALQFPLALVIGGVAVKVFDSIGWGPSEVRTLTVLALTAASTTLLTAAVSVHVGFTTSSDAGLLVPLATSQLICGAACVSMGVKNILYGDNQSPPRVIY